MCAIACDTRHRLAAFLRLGATCVDIVILPAAAHRGIARKTFGDGNTATVISYPRPATAEGALFVNGVLVCSLDLNDTYIGTEPLHPSEVLPTALALCEENGRSGRDLIEAMVAGYEASLRVNDAISFIERGFHPLCAA
jgi:2-methylcitrate dehydratase